MAERARIMDDLAGVAGGALSALTGLRDEAEAIARARLEETIRALDLVRRSIWTRWRNWPPMPAPGRRQRRRNSLRWKPSWPCCSPARATAPAAAHPA